MHKENLLKLAEYLDKIPTDYKHFGMECFMVNDEGCSIEVDEVTKASYQHCGTAACAVGHAPLVKGLEIRPTDCDWNDYCERIFAIDPFSSKFEWMFGGSWHHSDDTPAGAAKRIRHLIAKGVPAGFTRPDPCWIEVYANA